MDRREVRHGEMTLEVDPHDVVPVGLLHAKGHLVPQDACVVHENVEGAIGRDRLVDQVGGSLPGADVVAVDHGGPTRGDDRVDNIVRRRAIPAFPPHRSADVVDDDRRSLVRQEQRVLTADAATRTGDDRHLAVQQSHVASSLSAVSSISGPCDLRRV